MYYDTLNYVKFLFILNFKLLHQYIPCLPAYLTRGYCLPQLFNLITLHPTYVLLARPTFLLYHVLTRTRAQNANAGSTTCYLLFFVMMILYFNNSVIALQCNQYNHYIHLLYTWLEFSLFLINNLTVFNVQWLTQNL